MSPSRWWMPDGHMERGAPNYRTWSRGRKAGGQHSVCRHRGVLRETWQGADGALYHDGEPVHLTPSVPASLQDGLRRVSKQSRSRLYGSRATAREKFGREEKSAQPFVLYESHPVRSSHRTAR